MSTVLERIQGADSDAGIRRVLNEGNDVNTGTKRSGKTRRRWLRAAKKRRIELGILMQDGRRAKAPPTLQEVAA